MTSQKANLLLLLAALIWGVTFVAQKTALEHTTSLYYTALRFMLGSMVVLPAIFWLQKQKTAKTEKSPTNLRFTALEWKLGITLGVVMFIGIYLQQISLETTSIAKSSFITGLYVVLVPIVGFAFGHKSSPLIILCAGIALIGLYFLSVPPDFSFDKTALGDFWALLGTVFWTAHVLLVSTYGGRGNPLHLSFIQFFFIGVSGLILSAVVGDFSVRVIPLIGWELLLGGIISVGLAFTLQIVGQRYTTASNAAIVLSLEAVFGALFGYLCLREGLSMRALFGALLMFAAMLAKQIIPHWQVSRREAMPLGK